MKDGRVELARLGLTQQKRPSLERGSWRRVAPQWPDSGALLCVDQTPEDGRVGVHRNEADAG